MEVRIRCLKNLLDPVDQLHIRIPAQLAEDRCAFDRLVGEAIKLAEKIRATDFAHQTDTPAPSQATSGRRHKLSASPDGRRRPSQVVHPSRRVRLSVNGGTWSSLKIKRTSQSSS